MAAISVSADTSFNRYPAAPALSAPNRLASSPNVVSASTGVPGQRSRMRAVAWMPSMTGICRSINTTAGCSRPTSATASSPLAASPTTSTSARVESSVRSPSRKSA